MPAPRLPTDDGYYDDVAPEDLPPPDTVGLFDGISMPADPLRQLGDDAE